MKRIAAFVLSVIMIIGLFSVNAAAEEAAAESPKDYQNYLWELTPDMSDEEFNLYALRNYKIIQSLEPLLDADSFKNLYKANVHLKQGAEGAKEEFIDAQNSIIMYTSMENGVIFLWDAENIPYDPADAALTDEELDAAPLDGVGFIPLLIKCLLEDPAQAKGNIVLLSGGAGNNRSNSGEAYPAAEVFNELGYNTFILQYRIAPYTAADRFMDTQRAIRLVKYYAAQEGWGGQDMIAAAGWSAGAMTICGMINTCYGDLTPADEFDPSYVPDEIDAINSDLDVAMPIYGAGISADCENPHIPAIYTAVGSEDNVVGVEGEQEMYDLVTAKGIPAQIHIFEGAGHGFGVGQEGALKSTDEVAVWPGEADAFMQANLGYAQKNISENAEESLPEGEQAAEAGEQDTVIDLTTETGSVKVEYYSGGEILTSQEGDDCLVQVPEGKHVDHISIYAKGGEINIIGVIADSYRLETVDSDINVYLPEDAAFHAHLVTISDLFESDFLYDVGDERHEYMFGEDGVEIEMETIIGTARVMILK